MSTTCLPKEYGINEYNTNYDYYKLWKNSDNAEYDDIQDYEILTLIDYEISTNSNRVKMITLAFLPTVMDPNVSCTPMA